MIISLPTIGESFINPGENLLLCTLIMWMANLYFTIWMRLILLGQRCWISHYVTSQICIFFFPFPTERAMTIPRKTHQILNFKAIVFNIGATCHGALHKSHFYYWKVLHTYFLLVTYLMVNQNYWKVEWVYWST